MRANFKLNPESQLVFFMKEDGKISNGSKGERLERDLDKKMLKTKIEILEGIRIRRSRRRRRKTNKKKIAIFFLFSNFSGYDQKLWV